MKILIVACGGFGVNMARETKDLLNGNMETGGSEIDALIIDGSDSNLRDNNDLSEFTQWLAPGKDGGGKIRKSNAKDYIEFLNSKIHEMPDADLYLVISSTAGGSTPHASPSRSRVPPPPPLACPPRARVAPLPASRGPAPAVHACPRQRLGLGRSALVGDALAPQARLQAARGTSIARPFGRL